MDRISLLIIAVLALGCGNANAGQQKPKLYWIRMAISPVAEVRECFFLSAADPIARTTIEDFRPSISFMKAACSHFNASWREQKSQTEAREFHGDFEPVVWHEESPDVPTFPQEVNM